MKHWSGQETAAFLDAVAEDRLYAAWLLFLRRGFRRGELAGLRRADVDLESTPGRIAVTNTVSLWMASRPSPSRRPRPGSEAGGSRRTSLGCHQPPPPGVGTLTRVPAMLTNGSVSRRLVDKTLTSALTG